MTNFGKFQRTSFRIIFPLNTKNVVPIKPAEKQSLDAREDIKSFSFKVHKTKVFLKSCCFKSFPGLLDRFVEPSDNKSNRKLCFFEFLVHLNADHLSC